MKGASSTCPGGQRGSAGATFMEVAHRDCCYPLRPLQLLVLSSPACLSQSHLSLSRCALRGPLALKKRQNRLWLYRPGFPGSGVHTRVPREGPTRGLGRVPHSTGKKQEWKRAEAGTPATRVRRLHATRSLTLIESHAHHQHTLILFLFIPPTP